MVAFGTKAIPEVDMATKKTHDAAPDAAAEPSAKPVKAAKKPAVSFNDARKSFGKPPKAPPPKMLRGRGANRGR